MRLQLAYSSVLCLAVVAVTAGRTDAGILVYTSQAAWQAAAGTTSLYNFNADATGNIATSKDFGPFTVERNTASSLNVFGGSAFGNIDGTNFLSYSTSVDTQSIKTTFDDSIMAFAFDWNNTDPSGDVIELIIGSSTFSVGGLGVGFFGVVEDTGAALGSPVVIQFSDTLGGLGSLGRANLDNFRYSQAPPSPNPPQWPFGASVLLAWA